MSSKNTVAKRHKQNQKRRLRNKMVKSQVKTFIKKYAAVATGKESGDAQEMYVKLTGLIDRAAQKGILAKNNAARKKSRLHKLLKK